MGACCAHGQEACDARQRQRELWEAALAGQYRSGTATSLALPPDARCLLCLPTPSPTLSPTDPVPRGLLTLCPAAY
jgi:hypothetical protein